MPDVLANRVTRLLGVEIPIVQAPMGWIARAALASAVSNAGAMGIIETSSGELDAVREEIALMKDLTDRPFGVNIAQAFVSDPTVIVDFVIDQGVKFVTTSAGSPTRYTSKLKDAGLTVFHVVPTLRAADKAVRAGVDGLIVEGGEGGGFKNPRPVSSMVLLPSVTSNFDLPVIAAGGFLDGRTMAAALALGAEGVQLGTAMVSSVESPVHDNWKQAIIDAAETDTVFLNSHTSPALRALRTPHTEALEFDHETNAMAAFGRVSDVYFGGDLGAGIALGGQVAGRIGASRPVAEIIHSCADECEVVLRSLSRAVRGSLRDPRLVTGAGSRAGHQSPLPSWAIPCGRDAPGAGATARRRQMQRTDAGDRGAGDPVTRAWIVPTRGRTAWPWLVAVGAAAVSLSACGLHVSKHGVSGNILGHNFSAASGSLPAGFPSAIPVPDHARVLGGGGSTGRWDVAFAATGDVASGISAYQAQFRSAGYTVTNSETGSTGVTGTTGPSGSGTPTTVTVSGSVFTATNSQWTVEVEAGTTTAPRVGSLKAGEYGVNLTALPTSSIPSTT